MRTSGAQPARTPAVPSRCTRGERDENHTRAGSGCQRMVNVMSDARACRLELPSGSVYCSPPFDRMSLARDGLRALTAAAQGIKMVGYPANALRFAALFEQ